MITSRTSEPKLYLTGVSVESSAVVGKYVKANASLGRSNSRAVTEQEKQRVSWQVLFDGKVIENLAHHGTSLNYLVPYFLVNRKDKLDAWRLSVPDKKDKGLPVISLVLKELKFKAYIDESETSRLVKVDPNYDRFDKILTFMHGEMTQNIHGKEAKGMRKDVQQGVTDMSNAIKARKAADSAPFPSNVSKRAEADLSRLKAIAEIDKALALYYSKVFAGGAWDHKVILADKYGAAIDVWTPVRGDKVSEYYYDVWSNIHFSYVGRSIGFPSETLMLCGAGIEGWGFGTNDESDKLSVQIGLDLWKDHGEKLKEDHIRNALLKAKSKYLELAKKDPANKKVRPMLNGY